MSSHSAVPLRRACSLAATLALVACSDSARTPVEPSSPALSAAKLSLPFTGTLESAKKSVVPLGPTTLLIHSEGTGTATHLGHYEMRSDLTLNLALLTGTEEMTLKAANGDLVYATATVKGTPNADGVTINVVETATIWGGTGRFAAATGNFILKCLSNQATGISIGSFDGTITLKH